ncbi:pilus assembly protein PilP [Vreelandella utahensis]|uniref:pilus assembly protein PilP n=1 Tax=Vreelandella halophila TaxID=86177 RepID=UPI0009879EA2|nr:pilus assembly protein PilP [Halomonas utahensis]
MRVSTVARYLVTVGLSVVLVACSQGQGYKDLDQFMKEARNDPQGKIEPLPEFKAYEAFTYAASDRRSPFEPPAEVVLESQEDDEGEPESEIKPDENRPTEPLERFEMSDLAMVGSLQRTEEGRLYALVQDPEGGIHRVTVGDYMGQNHGRVERVTETGIQLREIVGDGSGGWVKRPRTLSLEQE